MLLEGFPQLRSAAKYRPCRKERYQLPEHGPHSREVKLPKYHQIVVTNSAQTVLSLVGHTTNASKSLVIGREPGSFTCEILLGNSQSLARYNTFL